MAVKSVRDSAAGKKEFFPTVAEIDLNALVHNLREIQRLAGGPGHSIMAVVKADAYGHGALRISRTLEDAGVKALGVALPQEGIELRQGGIRLPILVMGSLLKDQIPSLFEFQLTPVLFQSGIIPLLEKEAEEQGVALPVHIKVDTGMGRLGIQPDEFRP
ncbi:MAG: alanine racemase, partial [Nitrospirae bacterium]|nr:alanine racemase [Nitrospirota bacterium]